VDVDELDHAIIVQFNGGARSWYLIGRRYTLLVSLYFVQVVLKKLRQCVLIFKSY